MASLVRRLLTPVAAGVVVGIVAAGIGSGPHIPVAFFLAVAIGCAVVIRRSDAEAEESLRDLSLAGWLAALPLWTVSESGTALGFLVWAGWWAFSVMLVVLYVRWAWRAAGPAVWAPRDPMGIRARRLLAVAWTVAFGLWWTYSEEAYSAVVLGALYTVTGVWAIYLVWSVSQRRPA